jgi:hypothetical protein
VYLDHQKLCDRKARFVLTIIETCNGIGSMPRDAKQAQFIYQLNSDSTTGARTPLSVLRMKQLFLQSNIRALAITAGRPGQLTLGTSTGSVFTNCFIKAVDNLSASTAPVSPTTCWRQLLRSCSQSTSDESRSIAERANREANSTLAFKPHQPYWDSLTQRPSTALLFSSLKLATSAKLHALPEEDVTEAVRASASTKTQPVPANGILTDTSIIRGYTLRAACHQLSSSRSTRWYRISLTIESADSHSIDSVKYFLHYSMSRPRVTIASADNQFECGFSVHEDYPVKAIIYLKNGRSLDVFCESLFTTCEL